ncbi:MAG: hypothetical protein ACLUOS_13265 [Odoribacter splanchnicus]
MLGRYDAGIGYVLRTNRHGKYRVKETALHEIFQLIEAQCGYTFVYNNEQLNGLKPVSIEMTDAKISRSWMNA